MNKRGTKEVMELPPLSWLQFVKARDCIAAQRHNHFVFPFMVPYSLSRSFPLVFGNTSVVTNDLCSYKICIGFDTTSIHAFNDTFKHHITMDEDTQRDV